MKFFKKIMRRPSPKPSDSWSLDSDGIYTRLRKDEYDNYVIAVVAPRINGVYTGEIVYIQDGCASWLSKQSYADLETAIVFTEYIQNGCIDIP